VPITGESSATGLVWERNADGFLYDWADNTFKASGWTTVTTAFSEIDSTNLPGAYRKTISVYQMSGTYTLYPKYTGAIASLNKYATPIELIIADGVIQNVYSLVPTVQQIRSEMDNNSTIAANVSLIPTNPLLTTDTRITTLLTQTDTLEASLLTIYTELQRVTGDVGGLTFEEWKLELVNAAAGSGITLGQFLALK